MDICDEYVVSKYNVSKFNYWNHVSILCQLIIHTYIPPQLILSHSPYYLAICIIT